MLPLPVFSMPENTDDRISLSDRLTEVLRKDILRAAEMKDLEERAREIGERTANLSPSYSSDQGDNRPVT